MSKKLLNRKRINPFDSAFTGEQYLEKAYLQLYTYNVTIIEEYDDISLDYLNNFQVKDRNFWLNIHGIHDVDLIKEICNRLDIHNLEFQDILDVNQRPKMQEYEGHCFFSLKSVFPSNVKGIEMEQISFILGKNYIVSFQERKGDYFEHIRERLRNKIGLSRERGPDFLIFLLFESILDNYNKTMQELTFQIENEVYIDINKDPSPSVLETIEATRVQIVQIDRVLTPVRDFIAKICREESAWINQENIKYYFELKDFILSILDECNKMESKLESNINLFFSVQGHRMNQVMKILTVVATIFIPLTFVAGIYGMNFVNIPELNWKWGYAGFWAVILMIFSGMILYFRRKKWF